METITYEEDLHTNPLFLKLVNKYSLLEEVCLNNWLIAVPKRESFSKNFLNNHEFLLTHILTPSEELPRTHFTNLLGDEVFISGTDIKIKSQDDMSNVQILFEEYFYTKDSNRYKIICLDKPLGTKYSKLSSTGSDFVVKNVQESIELIRHKCTKQVERKIDNGIKNFNSRIQNATDYESLQKNVKLLYDYCVNITCSRKVVKDEPFMTMNLKFAIEYIVLDAIYEKIFDAISIRYAEENEKFNKVQKKIASITLEDLGISDDVSATIHENLNVIKLEMMKIDSSRTSLDKLSCIKNVIDVISNMTTVNLTTDLLLPCLVYIMIKTSYYSWIPTIKFIKEYNLSDVLSPENQSSGNALLYILTTLEAIIYFIQTNESVSLKSNVIFNPKNLEEISCQEDYLLYMFTLIRDSNEIQLDRFLKIPYSAFKEDTQSRRSKCHPLCVCEKCETKISMDESGMCNVNDKSSQRQLTMLHIAAIYNAPKIVGQLINQGADVNAKDVDGFTPLHYASQKGYQKVLFMLLHNQNDSVNLRTNKQQTALILASMYGHEQCVKALLFFAEHMHSSIDINAQDSDGMTALHYATQCSFNGIVDNLLEYQAKVTLKNNIYKMPVDYAKNSVLKRKLEQAAKYQVEELPITESEFIFIRKEDLADIFKEVT